MVFDSLIPLSVCETINYIEHWLAWTDGDLDNAFSVGGWMMEVEIDDTTEKVLLAIPGKDFTEKIRKLL